MKRMAIAFSCVLFLVLLAGCGSISLGDGQTLSLSTDGIAVTDQDGESVLKIDGANDGFTLSVKDESGGTIEQTVKTELPAAFPADIPIPAEAHDIVSIDTGRPDDSVSINVSYQIQATVYEYYNLYREYLNQAGYEIDIDASQGKADPDTKLENMIATRGDEGLMVGISVTGTGKYDDGTIAVRLAYTKK